MVQHTPSTSSTETTPTFAQKVWITVGVITAVFIALFLLWFALKEILAIFAGILLAVFLHGVSQWLADRSFLSRKASLFLTIAILIILFVVAGIFLIPNVVEQSSQLSDQLSASLSSLETRLSNSSVGNIILEQISGLPTLATGNTTSLLSNASSIFSNTMDAFVRAIIALFVGIYLAYEPNTYINGLLKLFPRSRRAHYHEALNKTGYALRWWLVGRLASMAIVGILSVIGLMLLDVPLAFILGLLAGLLAFIPLIGPTLALFPPLLIAFTDSPQKALYVFLLYMGIQFIESYFLTPLIQRKATSLPPVLLIASQVIWGLFAGLLGVMLAAPLAVTGMVLVKMLYVEDVLHDHTVEYLKDSHQKEDKTRIKGETKVHPF
jgi:predicted PurR-regulated permease PerM